MMYKQVLVAPSKLLITSRKITKQTFVTSRKITKLAPHYMAHYWLLITSRKISEKTLVTSRKITEQTLVDDPPNLIVPCLTWMNLVLQPPSLLLLYPEG